MDPLVTYVVPCYNNARFVTDSLNSIKNQRAGYNNIEIIFVDDGSTDESSVYAERCLEGSQDGDRVIKLLRRRGVGHALNVGFDEAKGEYICFHSSDDVLLDPFKTALQQVIMQTSGADLSYFIDWYEGTSKEDMKRVSGKWAPDWLPVGNILKRYLHKSNWLLHRYLLHHDPINSGTLMITKEAYQKYGKWNETVLTTDYELLLRYSRLGAKFCQIKGAPLFYRVHAGQSNKLTTEMREGEKISRSLNR